MIKTNIRITLVASVMPLMLALLIIAVPGKSHAQLQDNGSVGIEGTVQGKPPANAPTIAIPGNGQGFSSVPITVSGSCQNDLLVEVFKNNVFAGSAVCARGSYSIQLDLFSGRNDLVARQYDALNQASPDSNLVSVTFNDGTNQGASRISLSSAYAKRGSASPLTWPLNVAGGKGPYAISVDWGDGTQPDLISRPISGEFEIKHDYKQTGTYKIIVRATDAQGFSAFLQLVGVKNGPTQQIRPDGEAGIIIREKLPLAFWIVVGAAIPFLVSAFWLGKKHQLQTIRSRIRSGKRAF